MPFATVAEASLGQGFSAIQRVDRERTVVVSADVDVAVASPNAIAGELAVRDLPALERQHGVRAAFAGEQAEQRDFLAAMGRGQLVALIAIYALLAVPLRSYLQPLVIMLVIPFGAVGAALGHLIMGYDLTMYSVIGIVALSGMVVNASLVLVDDVNQRRTGGDRLIDAVRGAGRGRLRAIFLTEITTFVGLVPMMFERAMFARFMIPLAISLAFGVRLRERDHAADRALRLRDPRGPRAPRHGHAAAPRGRAHRRGARGAGRARARLCCARAMGGRLHTRIVKDVHPCGATPARIRRAFETLLAAGHRLCPAGTARTHPAALLGLYPPRYAAELFDARFYLAELREDENFRFFVAYVQLGADDELFPRLFYKDSSLVWRCATHVISAPGVHWIGKGDLKRIDEEDGETEYSAEETTNLPLELQAALDELSRRAKRVAWDARALRRLLRRAPIGRYEAYADFLGPRRRAARVPRKPA